VRSALSSATENNLYAELGIRVIFTREDHTIACEISITTSIDHEVGNTLKCLKAGAHHIAVICIEPERLSKIDRALSCCLSGPEKAKIGFYVPDQFLEYLALLAKHAAPAPKSIVKGGRKVTARFVEITEEERRRREALMIETIARTMRDKAGQ